MPRLRDRARSILASLNPRRKVRPGRADASVLFPYEPSQFGTVTVARAVALLRLSWQLFLDQKMSLDDFICLVGREDRMLEEVLDRTFKLQPKEQFIDLLRSSGKVKFDPEVLSDFKDETEAYADIVNVLMGIDRYEMKEQLLISKWDLPLFFKRSLEVVSSYSSYEDFMSQTMEGVRVVESKRHDPAWVNRVLDEMKDQWEERTKFMMPELSAAISESTHEYLVWLHHHPEALNTASWSTFERLVAEIFSSRGFNVELTARVKNKSADIIAISTDSIGIETKYLIECKCYNEQRRVGFDVVNAVLGAKVRQGADHALLVTSSAFTNDVIQAQAALHDLRLTLKDGEAVREWLKELKPSATRGAFLQPGWEADK
jgi:HJR/Mrr/RecB family endonuclease